MQVGQKTETVCDHFSHFVCLILSVGKQQKYFCASDLSLVLTWSPWGGAILICCLPTKSRTLSRYCAVRVCREREERLAALSAQAQAQKEELQKKIQQKVSEESGQDEWNRKLLCVCAETCSMGTELGTCQYGLNWKGKPSVDLSECVCVCVCACMRVSGGGGGYVCVKCSDAPKKDLNMFVSYAVIAPTKRT